MVQEGAVECLSNWIFVRWTHLRPGYVPHPSLGLKHEGAVGHTSGYFLDP